MDKNQYNKLATRFGHQAIHFTVKDGKINKKVEAK